MTSVEARTIYLLVGAGLAVLAICLISLFRLQERRARTRLAAAEARLTQAREQLAKLEPTTAEIHAMGRFVVTDLRSTMPVQLSVIKVKSANGRP